MGIKNSIHESVSAERRTQMPVTKQTGKDKKQKEADTSRQLAEAAREESGDRRMSVQSGLSHTDLISIAADHGGHAAVIRRSAFEYHNLLFRRPPRLSLLLLESCRWACMCRERICNGSTSILSTTMLVAERVSGICVYVGPVGRETKILC